MIKLFQYQKDILESVGVYCKEDIESGKNSIYETCSTEAIKQQIMKNDDSDVFAALHAAINARCAQDDYVMRSGDKIPDYVIEGREKFIPASKVCPDCKGSKIYTGLTKISPCKCCNGIGLI